MCHLATHLKQCVWSRIINMHTAHMNVSVIRYDAYQRSTRDVSSPHMRVPLVCQTTYFSSMLYHIWPLVFFTVGLYPPNTALGGSLAIIFMAHVAVCMTRIWRISIMYRYLTCMWGTQYISGCCGSQYPTYTVDAVAVALAWWLFLCDFSSGRNAAICIKIRQISSSWLNPGWI